MNDFNKRNLNSGWKVFLIFLFSMVAIMSFSGVLNAVTVNALESFIGWVAGVNFIAEGVLIYLFGKNLFKKDEPKKDE